MEDDRIYASAPAILQGLDKILINLLINFDNQLSVSMI